MMECPFSYVQDEIVGRPQEEMLSKIRGLKQEIGKLKNKAENMADDEIRFCPSYETQIKVMRDYLDLAIFEYEKAGGKYEMSVREKRAAAFDEDIDSIVAVILRYGGFCEGTETRRVFFEENEIKTERMFSNGLEDDGAKLFDGVTKAAFLNKFYKLHIGEWNHKYEDPDIYDGTQWELVIEYENRRNRTYWGSNKFPYNFEELLGVMEFKKY
jgi:hypothetical protein